MARLGLKLLGGFQARLGPGRVLPLPSAKGRALLAYLALHPDRPHPRASLTALLWADSGETQARQSLRQALSRVGTALRTTGAILIERETVALKKFAVDVDVVTFERLVSIGTPDALEKAVAHDGDLLEGFVVKAPAFEEWLTAERQRLREMALSALSTVLSHQVDTGRDEAVIQTALRLLARDPFRETAHRTLMRSYVRLGRRRAALQQYRLCADALQRELGVEPETETRQLYQDILAEPSTDAPARRLRRRDSSALAPASDPPLIGRGSELARLGGALDEVWRGHGHVAAVLGEAGVGKSRLVEDVASRARARGARVLIGRCYETSQILAFGPWVEALRAGGVIPSQVALEGLDQAWRTELARLFPELGTPGTEPSLDAGAALRLFEAIARLLEHVATTRPLLLILEDLHWADDMSLRLLSFVGRRVSAWPVVVLMTARVDELAEAIVLRRTLQELQRDPGLSPLMLPPLSQSDTETLVRALAPAFRDPARLARLGAQVWSASQGNPFVVVETVRALAEGALSRPSDGLALPAPVRDMIAGRLERLGEQSRRLLALAAVIARDFDLAVLRCAAGLGEAEAADRIEELVGRRLLREVDGGFDFVHDRIREVVSAQLLRPRRTLLHRQVAEALETLHAANPEPHYTALGMHYREGEVWDKALGYLRQAGHQAAGRGAWREAVRCFEQALGALRHLPESRSTIELAVDLRSDLQGALFPLGELERMVEHLREAEALATALGDQRRLGRVSAHLTHCLTMTGDLERAVEAGQRALGIASAVADRTLAVLARFHLGQAYVISGQYRRALEVFRANVDTLVGALAHERFGMPGPPSVTCRVQMARCLANLGDFAAARRLAEEAVRLAAEADHPYSLVYAHWGLGLVNVTQGRPEPAIAGLEQGLELCQRGNVLALFPAVVGRLGQAHALAGRPSEAVELLQRGAQQSASMKFTAALPLRDTALAEAYLLAGQLVEARQTIERALGLSRTYAQPGVEAEALRLAGELHSRREPPDLEGAKTAYREALALGERLEMWPLIARCLLGLAHVHRRTGGANGDEQLATAVRLLREMDMELWLMEAEEMLRAG